MTGIKDSNYPAFKEAKNRLTRQGFDVKSPHEIDELELMIDPSHSAGTQDWKWYMIRALRMQLECSSWVGLSGWQNSKGAMREFQIAVDLGHALYLYRRTDPKHGSSGLEPL